MSSVGTGFGSWRPSMRVNRIPKNPMDKCTIVSIYPMKLRETKPTCWPNTYEIPAAKDDDFELLVVGTASWFKEQEPGMPFLEIPVSSTQVAEGFIRDYVNGLLGYNPSFAMPGLFYVLGAHTKATIAKYVTPDRLDDLGNVVEKGGKTFKELLEEAKVKQDNWYAEIIKVADVMWARSNGNPLAIGADARLAAEKRNLKNKAWMQDFATYEKTNCKACGSLINPQYPVCPTCKAVVNESLANDLKIKFAS